MFYSVNDIIKSLFSNVHNQINKKVHWILPNLRYNRLKILDVHCFREVWEYGQPVGKELFAVVRKQMLERVRVLVPRTFDRLVHNIARAEFGEVVFGEFVARLERTAKNNL